MAPGFYIDVTPVSDIHWLSSSDSSSYSTCQVTQPAMSSASISRTDVYVNPYSGYLYKKKEETRKQRLIRWATAFKIFYPKWEFVLVKTEKAELAAYRESYKRRLKFKGHNRNLIL